MERYRLQVDDPCRVFRAKELAALLSMHVITVWRWAREGRLPAPFKLGTNTTVWRATDIAAWLDEKQGEQAADDAELRWLEADD